MYVSVCVCSNPTGVCLDRCCSLAWSLINAENLTCWLRSCCCSQRTWASINNLAMCKGVAAGGGGITVLELWLIDAPRILFVYLFKHTFVFALWSAHIAGFQAVNARLRQKLINRIRNIRHNKKQTSNKHFTNCYWQLGAFALFILAHKRLYMIMHPLAVSQGTPSSPSCNCRICLTHVRYRWLSLRCFFCPPHIFSFSISPIIARFV